jgi:hypothetical protein
MFDRGWKLNDPVFDSLPKRFDKVRVQELLDLVQSGKIEYKDDLILQLLIICRIVIIKKLFKNPSLHHSISDLIGTLVLRTCMWVDELSKQQSISHPTVEYYWQIIKNEIYDFNDGDSNPNVTGSWLRQQHGNGKIAPIRLCLKDDLLFINPTIILDLEDVLITLAETDRERDFVILRFQGYTDADIAKQFDVHETTVRRTRLALEKRYDDYLQLTRGVEE